MTGPEEKLERLTVPIAVAAGAGFAALLWAGQVGIGLIGASPKPASQLFSDTTRSLGVSGFVLLCLTLPLGLVIGRRWVAASRAAALTRPFR